MTILFDALAGKFNHFDIDSLLNEDLKTYVFSYTSAIAERAVSVIAHAIDQKDAALFSVIASTISQDIDNSCKHFFDVAKASIAEDYSEGIRKHPKGSALELYPAEKKKKLEGCLLELFRVSSLDEHPVFFIDIVRSTFKELISKKNLTVDDDTSAQLSVDQIKTFASTLQISSWDIGLSMVFGTQVHDCHPFFYDSPHIDDKDYCNYIALGDTIKDANELSDDGDVYYLCQNNIPDNAATNPIISGLGRLNADELIRPYSYEKRRYELFKHEFKDYAQVNFALEEFITHEFDDLRVLDQYSKCSAENKVLVDFAINYGGISKANDFCIFKDKTDDLEIILLHLKNARNLFSETKKDEKTINRIKRLISSISTTRAAMLALDGYLSTATIADPAEFCNDVFAILESYTGNYDAAHTVYGDIEKTYSMPIDDLELPNFSNLIGSVLKGSPEPSKQVLLSKVGSYMPIKSWGYLLANGYLSKDDTHQLIQRCRYIQQNDFAFANVALHVEQLSDFAASCENKYAGCVNDFLRIVFICSGSEFENALLAKVARKKNFDISEVADADMNFLNTPAI